MDKKRIGKLVKQLYETVDQLEELFPGRRFTPDGHMVGSIGECLVADAYGLELMPPSNRGYDAISRDGVQVEIKATQGDRVAFRSCPQHTIIVRIYRDGTFEEYYNGPGSSIWQQFEGRALPGNGQYQIGLTKAQRLDKGVPPEQKIPRASANSQGKL